MSNKNYKLYMVGGVIRDRLLGVRSKDIDFSFEFTPEVIEANKQFPVQVMYENMNRELKEAGFDIFLEVPEAFTTRARFPEGDKNENLTADFVLCRKETYPNSSTRMPVVEIGTLYDDLKRRDFCMNAIAADEDGKLIDPFNGVLDIKNRVISCPVSPSQSFNDDPLRMLRALRFSVTKDFAITRDIYEVIIRDIQMWEHFSRVVSEERIREELFKMFKHDTVQTMRLLIDLDDNSSVDIFGKILGDTMWLKPTTEKKK